MSTPDMLVNPQTVYLWDTIYIDEFMQLSIGTILMHIIAGKKELATGIELQLIIETEILSGQFCKLQTF